MDKWLKKMAYIIFKDHSCAIARERGLLLEEVESLKPSIYHVVGFILDEKDDVIKISPNICERSKDSYLDPETFDHVMLILKSNINQHTETGMWKGG